MKLNVISGARNGIACAYNLKLTSGLRALKLRKVLVRMDEELRALSDVMANYGKAIGKDKVKITDPEYGEAIQRYNEALEAEVDIAVEPLILFEDIERANVSASDLDALIKLGLLAEPVEKKPE